MRLDMKFVGGFLRFLAYLLYLGWRALCAITKYYWRRPLRALADAGLAIVFGAILYAGMDAYQMHLEATVTNELIEKIDQASTFKRQINRVRATENSQEFLAHGAPEWLRKVTIRTIIVEAWKAGLDTHEVAVLLTTADRESGFNPFAKARETSACGIFQFVDKTGRAFGISAKDCMEPTENTQAEIAHFRRIMSSIEPRLRGLDTKERLVMMFRESYCKHHDGQGSKSCSSDADMTVSRGLSLLLTAHRELEAVEKAKTNAPGFSLQVFRVLSRGSARVRENVVFIREFWRRIVAS